MYFGAIIGEFISYWIGYYYHLPILEYPIIKRHDKIINKSQKYFERHGAVSVFFARFFGPTRAFVPFIAGISQMRHSTFIWVNCISGLLWAPFYLIPGVIIGASLSLDTEYLYHLLLIVSLISIAIFVAYTFTKRWLARDYVESHFLTLICKCILSWSIVVVMIVILIKSPYVKLLIQIKVLFFNQL